MWQCVDCTIVSEVQGTSTNQTQRFETELVQKLIIEAVRRL